MQEINYENLSEIGKILYDSINAYFSESTFYFGNDALALLAEPIFNLEGYYKTNNYYPNTQISFYVSTDFLGYFKTEILLGETNEIYITNISDIESNDLKENLCANLTENIKKTSIKAKLFFMKKKDNDEFALQKKQLFIINSTDSVIGLTLIQLIARTIFEFDEKQGQRYSQVNEK